MYGQIQKKWSRPKTANPIETTFDDLILDESLLKDLKFSCNQLISPEPGLPFRKGILLYGPSGTGKTSIAKAMANFANSNLIVVSGSSIIEEYAGLGARRVRDIFTEAREKRPCIIFIDELDALGRRGTSAVSSDVSNERNQTINQLLVEMDGFEESDGFMVVAATNRIEYLDPALIRSGRFDLKIKVSLPTGSERQRIIQLLAKKAGINQDELEDTFIEDLVTTTEGFSQADLDNAVNEAIYLNFRSK